MDMGFAINSRHAGFARGHAPEGFDWHGLHARLTAAHAARRSILDLSGAAARLGSFDGEAAAILADHEMQLAGPSQAVNPTDLADGKVPAVITADVAGSSNSGDRGK